MTVLGGSITLKHLQENPFQKCDNLESISSAMADYSRALGLPFFSYLLLKGGLPGEDVLLTNYDSEWRQRYVEKSYKLHDPAAIVSRRSRLPFWWDQNSFLRPFQKAQQRVFFEAREFRINAGYSVPVAGPGGDQAVFSLAATNNGDMVDAVRNNGPDLLVTALQAHDRVMSITCPEERAPAPQLSARELECLKWTAEGKTSAGIGDKICVSSATVNYHLNNAIKKLGASNRHHAAILAMRKGLIS